MLSNVWLIKTFWEEVVNITCYLIKKNHEIMVDREGFSFNAKVAYELLLDFCTHCQNIGHDVSSCRWLYLERTSMKLKKILSRERSKYHLPNLVGCLVRNIHRVLALLECLKHQSK